jgi:hypothetical protein
MLATEPLITAFSVLRAMVSAPDFVYLWRKFRGLVGFTASAATSPGELRGLGRGAKTTRLTQQRAGLDRQLELLTWLNDDHRHG